MVGQAITFTLAFYVAFIIYRKNIDYIGNKLFIISFLLFGIYAFVLFLYEFPISLTINEFLIRSSLLFVVLGVLFLVLSMQVFVQSSTYLNKPIAKLIILGSILVCFVTLLFPYRVTQIQPEIEAEKNIFSLLSSGLWSLGLMLYNVIRIFRALKKMDETNQKLKEKIRLLGIAQIFGILSPIMSVIGNIIKNSIIHAFMFIFLAIPMVIVGLIISKEK
jgi:hypothetical protein